MLQNKKFYEHKNDYIVCLLNTFEVFVILKVNYFEKIEYKVMESKEQTNSSSDETKDNQKRNDKKPNGEQNDSNCKICLNVISNRATTDTCHHSFCFDCLRQWSQTHNECPFCRRLYHNIIYNIRLETQFDRMTFEKLVVNLEKQVFPLVI